MESSFQKGKQIREKKILDFHHTKLGNETIANKKKRKKVIQRIIKDKKRNHQFQYMIKYLGKGVKEALRKLHIRNDQQEIIKTLIDRKEIETAIIQYNRKYLNQAHNTLVYNDKIYK